MWGSLLSECLSKLCDGHNSVRDCGPSQFMKMFIHLLKRSFPFVGYMVMASQCGIDSRIPVRINQELTLMKVGG